MLCLVGGGGFVVVGLRMEKRGDLEGSEMTWFSFSSVIVKMIIMVKLSDIK